MSVSGALPTARTATADGELPVTFEEFVATTHAGLFGAMCLLTRDRSEAEDVMQEALLAVWERWDRVGAMDDPEGYLYRTAFNAHHRRRRRAALAVKRAVKLAPPPDRFGEVETRDVVMRALGSLSPRQREAVVLTELLDFPSGEAAAIMGISSSTVRVLASQGRERLRLTVGDADE